MGVGVGHDDGVEGARGQRPQEHIPVEARRHGGVGRRLAHAGARLVHHVERADQVDRAEHPCPHDLDHAAVVAGRVNLRADLGDAVVLLRRLHHGLALGHVERHRLLDIKILPRLGRVDGHDRVPVGRSCDADGVNRLLVEELSEVVIAFGRGLEAFHHRLAAWRIHIADGGDPHVLVRGEGIHVARAHRADADEAHRDRVAGRRGALGPDGPCREPNPHRPHRRPAQERPTRNRVLHRFPPFAQERPPAANITCLG